MKFVFRLESFLGLKEKLEDQRKLEYGRALAELERERQSLKALQQESIENILAMKKSIEEDISPLTVRNYNDYVNVLKKRISDQQQAVTAAENVAEKKRLELVEAMKERKMLDTLKDKARKDYLHDVQLAEQRVTDEIVSYRFNNKSAQLHGRAVRMSNDQPRSSIEGGE